MNQLLITWKEITKHCQKLANDFKFYGYTTVLVVAKGGMIPAGIIAQHMPSETRFINMTATSLHSDPTLVEPKLWFPNGYHKFYQPSNMVVLDDIADSGETFKAIKDWLGSRTKTAAVFSRWSCKEVPDHVGGEIYSDDWLVFPWESATPGHHLEKDTPTPRAPESRKPVVNPDDDDIPF
jgi:hypoxanthine phosphoribosyltransferase